MMRGTRNRKLLDLLEQNEALKTKGFSIARTQTGGIVIDRSGHVHGIWDFDGYCYAWVSPSSSEPIFRTDDLKSAVLYTLLALAQV